MTTFTTEDQALLDDLTHRKGVVAWQEREAARIARLAALSGLARVFTAGAISPIATIAGEQAEALKENEPDVAELLSNIAIVMSYAGMEIVRLLERVSIEEPRPLPADVASSVIDDEASAV